MSSILSPPIASSCIFHYILQDINNELLCNSISLLVYCTDEIVHVGACAAEVVKKTHTSHWVQTEDPVNDSIEIFGLFLPHFIIAERQQDTMPCLWPSYPLVKSFNFSNNLLGLCSVWEHKAKWLHSLLTSLLYQHMSAAEVIFISAPSCGDLAWRSKD